MFSLFQLFTKGFKTIYMLLHNNHKRPEAHQTRLQNSILKKLSCPALLAISDAAEGIKLHQ